MHAKSPTEKQTWSRRPNFAPRQLLTAKQLNAGLGDELMRQRLLNRSLYGYGVVLGLGLSTDEEGNVVTESGCVELGCGLALDRHGRMLYWRGGWIGMHDIVGPLPDCEGHYTLCLHYSERIQKPDGCLPFSSDDTKWLDQGVVFTLTRECQPVDRGCPDHPAGECFSHDDYLCQRTGALSPSRQRIGPTEDLEWVCEKPEPLCPTDCGSWGYDPRRDVCVPLACVEICDLTEQKGEEKGDYESPDAECEPKYGFCSTPPEQCEVRPYVYRNPLLYELLNCCDVDLPRVSSVSWHDWLEPGWHYPVPWREFADRIVSPTGFSIDFSKPIHISTLHPGSIFLTAVYEEERTDYWMAQRVPLRELRPIERDGDYASAVQLIPQDDWIAAEITGRRSTLYDGARFELTVRGQLLRDECGQMLDARPLDIESGARCQSRPGGDFTSVFQVAAREDDDNDNY